jgi:adenosylcobinamide-GDP ribazoletransferase
MHEALAFLTVFGGSRSPSPRALRWFPVIGAAIGSLMGAIWWLGQEAFPPLLAAVLVVIADMAVTGMLHVDGLADAADGLLPHATPARRLEIMRAADVGAFGVGVVAVVLLARVAALASRPADVALLASVWCISRSVAAVTPAWFRYVRSAGLASAFLGAPARWPALAIVPATALAVVGIGWPGLVVSAITVASALAVVAFSRVRIGGFTGDVLGAAIVVGETMGLVAAAARW